MSLEVGALEILDEREKYSMISSWNEFLCIERFGDGEYEISVRGATVLEEARTFFNEETEEIDLPDFIDGHCVIGTSDGVVIGEPLEVIDGYSSPLRFHNVADETLVEWLESNNWLTDNVHSKIRNLISIR